MEMDTARNTGPNTEGNAQQITERNTHDAPSGKPPSSSLHSGSQKPKGATLNPRFRGIPITTRRARLLAVEVLANEYLSAEQIRRFAPGWGLKLDLTTIHKYLRLVRLPPGYRQRVEKRSWREHDVKA